MVHTICLRAWFCDKHTLSHAEREHRGRCPSPASLRAVPPQLHCHACQPLLQIGMVWIALPLRGTGQSLITKRASFLGRIPDCISSTALQIVSNDSLLILRFGAYLRKHKLLYYSFWGEGGEKCLISHRLPRRSCLLRKQGEKSNMSHWLWSFGVLGVSNYIL